MLDHLVQFGPEITTSEGFKPLDKAGADEVLSAQVATADWLQELGVDTDDEIIDQLETATAREAFQSLVTAQPDKEQKQKLVQIKTPEAVRHITGMLTAYDWEFVQQAKELRGYTVAKLVEETQNPNANIRLKALGLLGKVTEVGLFTEKIEIKKVDASDEEIEQRIKEKLNRFMGVVDVIDVESEPEEPLTPPDEPTEPDNVD
tara:strand:+ start:812 stop:1423 length:612 start_codon:yes stop_codon:yes gene_type:complete